MVINGNNEAMGMIKNIAPTLTANKVITPFRLYISINPSFISLNICGSGILPTLTGLEVSTTNNDHQANPAHDNPIPATFACANALAKKQPKDGRAVRVA